MMYDAKRLTEVQLDTIGAALFAMKDNEYYEVAALANLIHTPPFSDLWEEVYTNRLTPGDAIAVMVACLRSPAYRGVMEAKYGR